MAVLWGPVTARAWEVILYEGRRHVSIEDVSDFYTLKQHVADGKKFTLTSATKTIEGVAGSKEIFINNVKFVLCFPIVQKNGRILISAMDVTKIIEPVMRPGKIENAGTLQTIILDAGHGGHDSGATSIYGREKDFTLDVILRTKKLLLQQGYQVRTTRQTDEFIPLDERPAIANRYRNAIFISVHFNKSDRPGANGIETYALAPRGVPSMDRENVGYSDLKQNPGNTNDSANIALATLMHSAMLRNLHLYDRGIKRARFVVIRDLHVPGVLLEGGFVDSALDGRAIATVEYRQRMAQSIVEAIGYYKRMVAHGAPEEQPTLVVSAGEGDAQNNASQNSSPAAAPTPAPTPMQKIGEKTPLGNSVMKINMEAIGGTGKSN